MGLHEDVRGFYVAMDEVPVVRSVEGRRGLFDDRKRLVEAEAPSLCDQRLQIVAVDVAHRDVEQAIGLSGVVDRDDVGVLDRRDQLRLTDEPISEARVLGEVGRKDLERGYARKTE